MTGCYICNPTRGHFKPAKHTCLGLGLKSITRSKKIIKLTNQFGHSIGYHIAEEIETELAITAAEKHVNCYRALPSQRC